jgi:hypothetical protein
MMGHFRIKFCRRSAHGGLIAQPPPPRKRFAERLPVACFHIVIRTPSQILQTFDEPISHKLLPFD